MGLAIVAHAACYDHEIPSFYSDFVPGGFDATTEAAGLIRVKLEVPRERIAAKICRKFVNR
jgi:hypothetical protein